VKVQGVERSNAREKGTFKDVGDSRYWFRHAVSEARESLPRPEASGARRDSSVVGSAVVIHKPECPRLCSAEEEKRVGQWSLVTGVALVDSFPEASAEIKLDV